MTQEDIFKMAQEAGFDVHRGEWLFKMLERFAALVAAAERNKVAQWMIDRIYATGHGDTVEDLLKELAQSVREEERELCAQLCEEFEEDMGHGMPQKCAAEIRERGEK